MLKAILIFIITLSTISIAPGAEVKENPFGVLTFLPWNHSWNDYMYKDKEAVDEAIRLIDQLGVSIIRVDFPWNLIEEKEGEFNFERLDHIVAKCQEKNIKILGVLGYTAPWTGAEWNNPPPEKKPFLNYIETTVARYKDSVHYWEFWNEPDSFFYWQPQDQMKSYTDFLKLVYPVIKSINPESKVLLGGLTSSGLFALRNILERGGGDYFDIINFHFFVDPLKRSSKEAIGWKLHHIQNEMQNYGFSKKIWITEIGSPGTRKRDECLWWYGNCPTERQQALFLNRVYAFLLNQKNVEKIFWAFLQDTNHFFSGVDYFGLLRRDSSKKPSYRRYQRIIRKWEQKNK